MVGSPVGRRVVRHRRVASHFALRRMRDISPIREADVRAARNHRRRERRRRASAQLLHDLKELFGVPIERRHRREPPSAPVLPQLPIVITSGESSGGKSRLPRSLR